MSRSRRACLILIFFFILSGLVYVTSYNVRGKVLQDKSMLRDVVLPDGEILKRLCLGYTNLGADLLWLRAVRYVYAHNKGDKQFTQLHRFFELITFLDPNYQVMYRIGGEAIREVAKDPETSVEFLREGIERFPANWEIAYELGRSYVALNRWQEATETFEKALEMPDAPAWISVHVAEGYYKQRKLEKALYWWEMIVVTTNSREIYTKAASKAMFIRALIGAKKIAEASSLYYEKYGHLPNAPEELVSARLLERIPEEPFNGNYIIDRGNFTVDSDYIGSLLVKCLDDLNSRVQKYYEKYGFYPETIEVLENDAELGKKFPRHPYDGEYFIDQESKKVLSTRDYLAEIKIK